MRERAYRTEKQMLNRIEELEGVSFRAISRVRELEAEVEQERAAHLATLKRVEWCDTNQFHFEKENRYYSLPCCPVCGRGKRWNEHKPDCRIAADLKRLEEK